MPQIGVGVRASIFGENTSFSTLYTQCSFVHCSHPIPRVNLHLQYFLNSHIICVGGDGLSKLARIIPVSYSCNFKAIHGIYLNVHLHIHTHIHQIDTLCTTQRTALLCDECTLSIQVLIDPKGKRACSSNAVRYSIHSKIQTDRLLQPLCMC